MADNAQQKARRKRGKSCYCFIAPQRAAALKVISAPADPPPE
jgi:hypothetical protein